MCTIRDHLVPLSCPSFTFFAWAYSFSLLGPARGISTAMFFLFFSNPVVRPTSFFVLSCARHVTSRPLTYSIMHNSHAPSPFPFFSCSQLRKPRSQTYSTLLRFFFKLFSLAIIDPFLPLHLISFYLSYFIHLHHYYLRLYHH